MQPQDVARVLSDPLAQELMQSSIPARLAYVGPDQWDVFEAQVRAMYKQMARIKITPLWAKLLDFQTRFPTAIEKLIRRAS